MNGGLCVRCAEQDRFILPQLARNEGWIKLIAGADYQLQRAVATPPDPEAERIRARKERKAQKRARLGRAIAGQFTRSTRSAA